VASLSRNSRFYTQADYDCQECGRPETDAMRKRVADFARPTCDECIERLAHEGHSRPDLMVSISHVLVVVDADGKRVEKRKDWKIPYREWDARCRRCFP
jgi:transposase-like protein